ncbi:MAG: DUF4810 domain-containing protein [bacterium]
MKRLGRSSHQQLPRSQATTISLSLIAAVVLSLLSGCATKTSLYDWRSYDGSMEQIYEKDDLAQAEIMLGRQMQGQKATSIMTFKDYALCICCYPVGIINLATKANDFAYTDGPRIPPGAHADYGFLLFRRGDISGGVSFFEMEKRAFPESAAFMDKVIDRADKKSSSATKKKTANTVPAGEVLADEASDGKEPVGKEEADTVPDGKVLEDEASGGKEQSNKEVQP